jgi:putative acetyltransferase
MQIRPLTHRDAAACHAIFHSAVHDGARQHYTVEQLNAWAPSKLPASGWAARLTQGFAVGAKRFGRLVGFFTLGRDGHIDFAYVLPNEMGKGTAGALYEACEGQARAWGLDVMDTEASHLARRFFEKRGWHVTAQQVVIRDGVGIENFRMEKGL